MTLQVQTQFTLEQYFDLEYQAPTRHEFVDGKMKTMSYTSEEHGLIISNLIRHLGNALDEAKKNCRVYPSDRMLFVEATENVFYPDVMIVCGKSEFKNHSKNMKATINPSVLIEVLSTSIKSKDRQSKNLNYRQIPSLQQYILVNQDSVGIEVFNRIKDSEKWTSEIYDIHSETVQIAEVKLEVKKIYQNIEFPDSEETKG